jgi:hypothetical protein
VIDAPVEAELVGEPEPDDDAQAAFDPGWAGDESLAFSAPEASFVARVPAPEPPRPRPASRRGIFFDVENTSRPEHVSRVLDHLALDWIDQGTEVIAVGNWRVIGHETARILARRGAQLVHSAPSVGVRDWSDLRIAVSAGAWLAATRPGDVLEVVSDDQAFDAVGDVAASLGVGFRRLSYRGLAGLGAAVVTEEAAPSEARPRRRRRGGRRGRFDSAPRRDVAPPRVEHPAPIAAAVNGSADEVEAAPSEELVHVIRELLAASPGGVMLDTLSNTLKARGFRRPAGSLRLVTRVRRIKELDVDPRGMIRLAGGAPAIAAPAAIESRELDDDAAPPEEAAGGEEGAAPAEEAAAPRRRRRRGGRRRRGRGRGGAGGAESTPDQAEG